MSNWRRKKDSTPLLHWVLFAYWAILLLWQNFGSGGDANRGGMDVLIKCGLILLLFIYYFMHATGIRRDMLFIIVVLAGAYAATQLTVNLSLSTILYYFFPLMLILLIDGIGWKFVLTKRQLIRLCNMLIIVVTYAALYALIFCFDQFKNAFSIESAYGHELKSFLMSSHEYGMYLAFGIMAAILCMEFDRENVAARPFYIAAIVLFGINMILTYSRTTLLSFAIMLLFYIFIFAKKSVKRTVIILIAIGVFVVLTVPSLREFIERIVLKDKDDAGRGDLLSAANQMYQQGSIKQKLFGKDFMTVCNLLAYSYRATSVHNAYAQQRLVAGVVGLLILIVVHITTFWDIYRTIKLKNQWSRMAKFFIGYAVASITFMYFNTAILYNSMIDSYFLTLFTVIVPKYVNRAIREGVFDKDEDQSRPMVRNYYHLAENREGTDAAKSKTGIDPVK